MSDQITIDFDFNKHAKVDYETKTIKSSIKVGQYDIMILGGKDTLSAPNMLLYNMDMYMFYEICILKNGSPIIIGLDPVFKNLIKLYPAYKNITRPNWMVAGSDITTFAIYLKDPENYNPPNPSIIMGP